jgi:hypothetical protein
LSWVMSDAGVISNSLCRKIILVKSSQISNYFNC